MNKGKEECHKEDCPFLHPQMCSRQLKCKKKECKFLHPTKRKVNKKSDDNPADDNTKDKVDNSVKKKADKPNEPGTGTEGNFQGGNALNDTSHEIKSLSDQMKEIAASVKILLQERETLLAWNWNPYQGQMNHHSYAQS